MINFEKLIIVISIVLPIIFVIIGYIILKKYGKDEKIQEKKEYYPIKDFNSLELSFLYKGKAELPEIASLLIHLANKGYIKIIEHEEKLMFGTEKKFKIHKIKEYDGNDINELLFFNGLFEKYNQEQSEIKNEIFFEDLKGTFFITVNKIKENINSEENINKIFEQSSLNKKKYITIMIVITFFIITVPPLANNGMGGIFFRLLFPSIIFSTMFMRILEFKNDNYLTNQRKSIWKNSEIIILAILGITTWLILIFPAVYTNKIYIIIYLIGLLCVFCLTACSNFLSKRTKLGKEQLEKIIGLKKFLIDSKNEELQSIISKDPNYFYDMLSYAYSLGVLENWLENFEKLKINKPDWYDGEEKFDIFIKNTMRLFKTIMKQKREIGAMHDLF